MQSTQESADCCGKFERAFTLTRVKMYLPRHMAGDLIEWPAFVWRCHDREHHASVVQRTVGVPSSHLRSGCCNTWRKITYVNTSTEMLGIAFVKSAFLNWAAVSIIKTTGRSRGDESSYLHSCQTSLVIVLHELSLTRENSPLEEASLYGWSPV